MNLDLNIASIREKALYLIPPEKEEDFKKKFDSEICYDLIENTEDYIAEGLASFYLNS